MKGEGREERNKGKKRRERAEGEGREGRRGEKKRRMRKEKGKREERREERCDEVPLNSIQQTFIKYLLDTLN